MTKYAIDRSRNILRRKVERRDGDDTYYLWKFYNFSIGGWDGGLTEDSFPKNQRKDISEEEALLLILMGEDLG